VSLLIHFSPDLGVWLTENLDRGCAPAALVRTMMEQRMESRVAQAIVDAFVLARRAQRPVPTDSVELEEEQAPEYACDPPRLAAGTRIRTRDREVRVVARADSPVMAILADVLSPDECVRLIELARPRLRPSTVVDPLTGQDVVAEHRSSFGMFFRLGEDAFIAGLDRRIAEVMGLPVENGEGFQVLHYPAGARNDPHFDFLQSSNAANRASIARSGQRVSTLIAYLNDVDEGGETVFPRTGWSVSPQRGHAVYFEYCNRLGQVDPLSLHAGQPVLLGEKWIATKWMRQKQFVSASAAASEGMMR
jgi:prolyl 4-hydroxylase